MLLRPQIWTPAPQPPPSGSAPQIRRTSRRPRPTQASLPVRRVHPVRASDRLPGLREPGSADRRNGLTVRDTRAEVVGPFAGRPRRPDRDRGGLGDPEGASLPCRTGNSVASWSSARRWSMRGAGGADRARVAERRSRISAPAATACWRSRSRPAWRRPAVQIQGRRQGTRARPVRRRHDPSEDVERVLDGEAGVPPAHEVRRAGRRDRAGWRSRVGRKPSCSRPDSVGFRAFSAARRPGQEWW